MASKLQIKPGLLARLRLIREIPSEEHQARLMGVDRTTLRRIDRGAIPSGAYTQNGLAVANFTIAATPRTLDRQSNEWKDGEALFPRASVWCGFAQHVASSLTKGSRVIA